MRILPTLTLLVFALPAIAQAEDGIADLGTLGGDYSAALGVSADGAVVVGWAENGDRVERAFRWTSGEGMVDLGNTLGGTYSLANGVSADGAVVVGVADVGADEHAFRWTSGGGMADLGTLGGEYSAALGVSADGAVVVGEADAAGGGRHAFRWTSDDGMADLGTLGGEYSAALGVSADGAVAVGSSYMTGNTVHHAFRWTSDDGMADLGTLGGTDSRAYGVSADGAMVVGWSLTTGDADQHAFRWTSGDMADLGTLGGADSRAYGVSADGAVVVGESTAGDAFRRAFRWTQGSGMQSVEDWLRDAGVTVPADITYTAYATNSDGSVVVGDLHSGTAFIARVSSIGSGLASLQDLQQSLAGSAAGGGMALSAAATVLNGAHSRPLSRRVAAGQRTFWLAGDWGRDDHGTRHGDFGLAEAGFGQNFGMVQVNVSLGQTWAKQKQVSNGRTKLNGTYLLGEALIPVAGNLWATLGGYRHWGEADMKRGYLNAGAQDFSKGSPDADTWGLRGRLEWDGAYRIADVNFSPYIDLTYNEAKLAAYTETGGGFPAHFDGRKEKATELRLGANAARPLDNGLALFGTVEAAHRFEKDGARTSGQVIGLFGFDLDGQKNQQDWLRAGIGLESQLAEGRASLSLNVTTNGETPNAWLAAGWQRAF